MCTNCITTSSLEVGRGVCRCIILYCAGGRAFSRSRFDTWDYNCRAWIVTRVQVVLLLFSNYTSRNSSALGEVEGGTTRVTAVVAFWFSSHISRFGTSVEGDRKRRSAWWVRRTGKGAAKHQKNSTALVPIIIGSITRSLYRAITNR